MNVFLSHSQADQQLADVFRAGLTDAGFTVNNSLADLGAGLNLHSELGKALEQSEAMIVLLTPDSVKSPYVRSEVEYALGSAQFRDRLIPVLMGVTDEVPWILRKLRFVRATKDVSSTVRQVAAALQKSAAAAA